MTPPATATARSAARAAPGTRRTPVRHPRRVSGPAGSARAAAAVAIPAPGIAPPRRRPPVKPHRAPSPKTRRSAQGAPGIALRAVGALDGLSRSSALDRLVRGRAWIGLLAFALIGIVTMQLLVLELNTKIGHTLTRVAQLQRENAQLGIVNSTATAESRIAPSAAAAGMTLAPVGTVHFVAASPANVARAAAVLSAAIQASASGHTESTEGAAGSSESSEATVGSSSATQAGSVAPESNGTPGGEATTATSTPATSTPATTESTGESAGSSSSSGSGG